MFTDRLPPPPQPLFPLLHRCLPLFKGPTTESTRRSGRSRGGAPSGRPSYAEPDSSGVDDLVDSSEQEDADPSRDSAENDEDGEGIDSEDEGSEVNWNR